MDPGAVTFDFGQGKTDQDLYDKVVDIRTQVSPEKLSGKQLD